MNTQIHFELSYSEKTNMRKILIVSLKSGTALFAVVALISYINAFSTAELFAWASFIFGAIMLIMLVFYFEKFADMLLFSLIFSIAYTSWIAITIVVIWQADTALIGKYFVGTTILYVVETIVLFFVYKAMIWLKGKLRN